MAAQLLAAAPRSWRSHAACAAPEADPEWWWPRSDDPGPLDDDWPTTSRALALCAACPVQQACRDAFVAQGRDEGGIWFATTPARRRRAARALAGARRSAA